MTSRSVHKAPKTKGRDALIAAALELFNTRGYDDTPVEAILARAGLSKGAFYHHFASKEAILDAVIERLAGEALAVCLGALGTEPLSAVERFNRVGAAARRWRWANFARLKSLISALYRPENLRLREKMNARATAMMLPVLRRVLEQGNAEKSFAVEDPEETALLLLELTNTWNDHQAAMLVRGSGGRTVLDALERRAKAYRAAVERILGAAHGTLSSESVPSLATAAQTAPKENEP